MNIVMARVAEVHPESNSVDVVLMQDNRRIAGVHVLSGFGGTNFGSVGLVEPDKTGYDAGNSYTRDIYCAVAWVDRVPVVLGFILPQVSQLLFEEKGRAITRHGSDVYWTIDKDANAELFHPSGWYFRLSADSEHEDLTAKDYDKKWKIERNDAPVKLTISNQNGFSAIVDEDGSLSITAQGVSIQSDVSISGNLSVSGLATAGEDVVGGGISLKDHTHPGVQSGGDETDPPN